MLKRSAVLFGAGIALSLLGLGCPKHGYKDKTEPPPELHYTIPRQCMISIELTPDSYCRGLKLDEMTCFHLKLEKVKNCELLGY